MYRISITFKPEALEAATKMRRLRGIPTSETFEGPVFEGNVSCEVTPNFLEVAVDKVLYYYNVRDVARFKCEAI